LGCKEAVWSRCAWGWNVSFFNSLYDFNQRVLAPLKRNMWLRFRFLISKFLKFLNNKRC
jgi:intracellular septation protein A